jgi:hypothetical protein
MTGLGPPSLRQPPWARPIRMGYCAGLQESSKPLPAFEGDHDFECMLDLSQKKHELRRRVSAPLRR